MTRLEMITYCVEDQIKRGVIPSESKDRHIDWHMNGKKGCKKMNESQCKNWYKIVKGKEIR